MAGDIRITIKDTGELKPLAGLRFKMTVGVHEQEASEQHGDSDLTVGEVALVNEFGRDNIPARMWFRRWAQKAARGVAADIQRALVFMAQKQQYDNLGLLPWAARKARDDLRDVALSGSITPANAPATLARKAPETRPMIDTQQLVNSIESAITGGKGWNFKTRGSGP